MRTSPTVPLVLAIALVPWLAQPARTQFTATKHPLNPCAPSIEDAAQPGECISASSVPLAGALLPLGPELFVKPSGEVGIGTMLPETALHVAGDLKAERCALGNQGAFGPGPDWDWLFDFSATITDFSTAGTWDGMSSWIGVDPDQDLVGANETWITGQDFYIYTPQGNDRDIYTVAGPLLLAEHQGSGALDYLVGGDAEAWAKDGRVQHQIGAYLASKAFGPADVADNRAVEVQSGHRGFGGIEYDCGIYVYAPHADGTLTNHYGLYLEDQDFGALDSYAIYSDGGTTYLAGDVGIGTDTPGAKLEVAGDLVASGTKSFVEPHPLDPTQEIRFVCLEGNEAGTYFRGSARLAGGACSIAVPEAFALVTEPAALTVQLTPLGPGADLWVARKDLRSIEVRGAGDVEFDYLVNGVRRGYAGFAAIRARAPGVSRAATRPAGTRFESDREARQARSRQRLEPAAGERR
jgi:hypothetical protein